MQNFPAQLNGYLTSFKRIFQRISSLAFFMPWASFVVARPSLIVTWRSRLPAFWIVQVLNVVRKNIGWLCPEIIVLAIPDRCPVNAFHERHLAKHTPGILNKKLTIRVHYTKIIYKPDNIRIHIIAEPSIIRLWQNAVTMVTNRSDRISGTVRRCPYNIGNKRHICNLHCAYVSL